MTAPVSPINAERGIRHWSAGIRFVIFGGIAELIAIEPDSPPSFPRALVITVRPGAGGTPLTILVPADFEPLVLPRHSR